MSGEFTVSISPAALTAVGALLTATAGSTAMAIRLLFTSLMTSKDQLITEQMEAIISWRKVALEAVARASELNDLRREALGKPLLIPLAKVIPESHSPPTSAQEDTAARSSARALLTALVLDAGLTTTETT